MSLYDKASIALIPSGTKASTLYSVLPANGDGDFTHSRSLTTATRVNKDGLIESVAANVPRLDYPITNGVVGDCPHLLLEPSRTNIIPYSEDFNQWTKLGTTFTITSNNQISPSGELNASTVNVTNNDNILYKSVSGLGSSSSDWNFTIYAKGSGTFDMNIRLNTSTITTETKTLTSTWQRFNVSVTGTPTINSVESYIEFNTSGTYHIWGAQTEAGSYATSYIPTSGSIATRSADVCNSAGTSAEFNGSEGVLFVELEAFENGGSTRVISISDGSTSNNVYLNTASSANTFTAQIIVNGSTGGFSLSTSSVNQTNNNKIAIKYKTNDHAMWVNGTEVDTESSHSTANMGTLDRLNFDFGTGSSRYYGKIKQVIYFNEALTDSELATLTS